MYWGVNSIIFLLKSFGRPYNKSSIKTSFERSLYPNDCTNSKTLARRVRRSISRGGGGGGAEQQKVFRSLDTIVVRAHWVYGILKIVLEFMKA